MYELRFAEETMMVLVVFLTIALVCGKKLSRPKEVILEDQKAFGEKQ